MFSVIMPTMWRVPGITLQALNNYINCDFVDEIIIINNDVLKTPYWDILRHPKVRLENQKENIYVNPAWNLGVELSRNDKLCIVNDDVVFDSKVFCKLYDRITPTGGVYGIIAGDPNMKQPITTTGSIDFIEWKPGDCLHRFGQNIFLHKSNWTKIPDDIKVFFGDDIILYYHSSYKKQKIWLIYNIYYFDKPGSTSLDTKVVGDAFAKEAPYFDKWRSDHPV